VGMFAWRIAWTRYRPIRHADAVCCGCVDAGQGYDSGMLDAEHVAALRAEGHSFRAIAAALGASLGAVQRAVKRHDTGLTITVDDDPAASPYDSYEPIAPFTFVGLAQPEDRRGNPLKDGNGRPFPPSPRAMDGRGVSVPNPELEMYRFCAHARAEGRDYDAERCEAHWAAQLDAAGVWCDDRGRWHQPPRAV
jgi:hypothetical protein